MAEVLGGADCSWPSQDEIAQATAIRSSCFAEIQALSDPTRDVVGDLRLCRFLRFNKGDVKKAEKAYRQFLVWRKNEDLETLRKGVIDLAPEDFVSWMDSVRSPFGPAANICLGDTAEGHMLVFASPGFFKAAEFVKQRPACHTMDTDLLICRLAIEWMLKRLDDRSYALKKMLYTIKIADMTNMGKEKIPILVPEIRNFAKTNVPPLMQMYCEHDILILVINAPFAFRVFWTFVSALISKRQQDRVKVFGSLTPAVQDILKSLAKPDVLPDCIGGTRTTLPMCFPLAQDDPKLVAEFMARTKAGVVRGQAPTFPAMLSGELSPSVSMIVEASGNVSVKPIAESPVVSQFIAENPVVSAAPADQADAKGAKLEEAALPAAPTPVRGPAPAPASAPAPAPAAAKATVIEADAAPKTGFFCCMSK